MVAPRGGGRGRVPGHGQRDGGGRDERPEAVALDQDRGPGGLDGTVHEPGADAQLVALRLQGQPGQLGVGTRASPHRSASARSVATTRALDPASPTERGMAVVQRTTKGRSSTSPASRASRATAAVTRRARALVAVAGHVRHQRAHVGPAPFVGRPLDREPVGVGHHHLGHEAGDGGGDDGAAVARRRGFRRARPARWPRPAPPCPPACLTGPSWTEPRQPTASAPPSTPTAPCGWPGAASATGWDRPRRPSATGSAAPCGPTTPGARCLVFRLEAATDLTGIASGTFAEPAFSWPHFRPHDRAAGGVPEGTTAFGHQYAEFAFPTSTDARLDRWLLLPHRPPVVWPLWLRAPDGGHPAARPARRLPRAGGGRARRAGRHGRRAVRLARRPRRGARRLRHRAGGVGRVEPAPAPRGLGRRAAAPGRHRPARALRRRARPPPVVLDRQRRRLLVPHRAGETVDRRRSWPPSTTCGPGTCRSARSSSTRGSTRTRSLRPFDTEEWEVPPTGLLRWEARDDILPEGVDGLAAALGRPPLAAHCRHLSSSSPYVEEVECWVDGDRAHPTGPELYERWLDSAVAWGVETFEHDWLVEFFLGVRQLRAVARPRPGVAGGARPGRRRAGPHAPVVHGQPGRLLPDHHAAERHLDPDLRRPRLHRHPGILWAWFLYGNVLARALGLLAVQGRLPRQHRPRAHTARWRRCCRRCPADRSASATASGWPTPPSCGATCRADGLLVKPDLPVAALDRCLGRVVVFSRELLQHVVGRHDRRVVGELAPEAVAHPAAEMDVERRGDEQPQQQVFGGKEFLDHRPGIG